MKKLSYVFVIVFTVLLNACSSDDSGENNNNNNNDGLYLKYSMNGKEYSFEPETMTSLQKAISGEGEVDGVQNRITLWMPKEPAIGSHTITDEFPNESNLDVLCNAYVVIDEEIVDATSGTLIITAVDDEYIVGTFSFSGTNDGGTAANVTNGSFRAYK